MTTAKCANCGEDTGKQSSSNWMLYCGKSECKQAAIDKAIADATGKKSRSKKA